MQAATVVYRGRPSPLAYMAGAFLPSPRFDARRGFPPLRLAWEDARIPAEDLEAFHRLTGLPATGNLPVIFPQVFSFRLQMALLTRPEFPMPLWNALQVRNHLVSREPIAPDDRLAVETRVVGHRVLAKGVEADLATVVRVDGRPAWEGVTTFYYRGRFGAPGDPSPLARPPEAPDADLDRWEATGGNGWRFGSLTGDFNGVHWWAPYARWSGFRGAFHHPQRVLGQCLARLPAVAGPARLDAWLRGPVYYGSPVRLTGGPDGDGTAFALSLEGDARPAVVGRLRPATPGEPIP